MSLSTLLLELRSDPDLMRHVVAWRRFPARDARFADLPATLQPDLRDALVSRGISRLFTHQAQAVEAVMGGQNVVVSTPTASGKTLCYNLPVLQELLGDSSARALYLFPTKALAQDQLAELHSLLSAIDDRQSPHPATYDGDTPRSERPRVRQSSRLLITNPDMLHTGILPHHTRWVDLFSNLRYVVLDELHAYRGVFGSHVANVLRRLRRICAFHGSNPQFICSSATISNAREHAQRLVDGVVTLIDDDGSPKGEKHFLLYNPPVVDQALGIRRSYVLEARSLAGRLLDMDVQTIVFARARLTVEVLLTYLRDWWALTRDGAEDAVRGYRGGYLPQQRREIERGLREGSVRGVVATNALELGIDIGRMSAAVLAGYPGSIASAWQQAGRAGRRSETSLAVMVASASPLDQYLVANPSYIFDRNPEHALINPDNLVILLHHMRCAAFELPFGKGESFGGVTDADELLQFLAIEGEIHQGPQSYHWVGETYPAQEVSLRTASPDRFAIHAQEQPTEDWQVIGEVDRYSVPLLLYEGAVYIHEGQSYIVQSLDWEGQRAYVQAAELDFYTDASSSAQVEVLDVSDQAAEAGALKAHGAVLVISKATGYRRVKRYTHENLGWWEIDLPELKMDTTAYWLSLLQETVDGLMEQGLWAGQRMDYGPNWAEQRDRARQRDGFRCQHCGARELGKRQHDVHHLRPLREFGYVRGQSEAFVQANRLQNLVTLCPTCHRLAETSQRVRSGLTGLSYSLSHMASLHLMCDPSDLGSIVEAKSASTGLPTITLYERVPAGLGFAAKLYELHETLLRACHDLISDCSCASGCPACIGPVLESDEDSKRLTLALIEAALKSNSSPRPIAPVMA